MFVDKIGHCCPVVPPLKYIYLQHYICMYVHRYEILCKRWVLYTPNRYIRHKKTASLLYRFWINFEQYPNETCTYVQYTFYVLSTIFIIEKIRYTHIMRMHLWSIYIASSQYIHCQNRPNLKFSSISPQYKFYNKPKSLCGLNYHIHSICYFAYEKRP